MNWTTETPTKPGAYWRRVHPTELASPTLLELYNSGGKLLAVGSNVHLDAALLSGEWCGPLVPVEEVARAWHEGCYGVRCGDNMEKAWSAWNKSRTKRKVEGEEV